MLDVQPLSPSRIERRNHTSRRTLLARVYGEFHEMPCLRLTAAQAQRLFGLRADVCARVLTGLVEDGWLARESERYRLNDSRNWPAGHPLASAFAH